jgi:hypothetical protein
MLEMPKTHHRWMGLFQNARSCHCSGRLLRCPDRPGRWRVQPRHCPGRPLHCLGRARSCQGHPGPYRGSRSRRWLGGRPRPWPGPCLGRQRPCLGHQGRRPGRSRPWPSRRPGHWPHSSPGRRPRLAPGRTRPWAGRRQRLCIGRRPLPLPSRRSHQILVKTEQMNPTRLRHEPCFAARLQRPPRHCHPRRLGLEEEDGKGQLDTRN